MLDIDMAAVAEGVTAALADGGEPQVPAVGDLVLSWHMDDEVIYDGPHNYPSGYQVRIGFGVESKLRCAPDKVAPVDTPLADPKDPRIAVNKSKRPFTHLPGDWCLQLPKQPATWHKTKRDATADGRRRLAILDWHASQAKASQENAEVPALAG